MGRVAEILAYKGREVHTIDQEASVLAAVERLVEKNVGALVVTDEGATVGIFTERDFLRRVAQRQRDPRTTRVREVMTERLICADPNHSIQDCMAMMTQERIRHLPVIEGARLAGLVSIGDLVKHVADERHVEIRYLTDYITGKYPV
jgi:CBS domain-containing protein